MKKLFSVFFFFSFLVLLLFLLFGGFEEEMASLLESRENRLSYGVASFALLSSDIFLPVPSSLVMLLNGKVLGIVSGAAVSTTSGLLSSTIGFFLGRKSRTYIDLYFSEKQKKASSKIFDRYGKVSIPFSKALPIISEAISFLSGTTGISFKKFFWYSLLGHLVISVVYAYLATYSAELDSNLLSGGIILLVLLIFWGADRIISRKVLSK